MNQRENQIFNASREYSSDRDKRMAFIAGARWAVQHPDGILIPQNERNDWSEEDDIILNDVINIIEGSVHVKYIREHFINWLKSIRPQKKQEWNKQDIEMIEWLIRCCEKEYEELCNDKYGHQDIVSDLKRDCRKKWDWLEYLKDKVVVSITE